MKSSTQQPASRSAQSRSLNFSSNLESHPRSSTTSPQQLSLSSAHRSTQTTHSISTEQSGDPHRFLSTSSHLSISPSFSRPKLIRHLLFSTPDSYPSSSANYQLPQQSQQQFKHQKSHTLAQNTSTSQPSTSIHSLSRSSFTRPHLSNLTAPLRVGLPLISLGLSHQSNHAHSHHHHHYHHHRSNSYHHHQLKQLIAVASRTEIRILEVINQHHSLPIEASHLHQPSNSSPALGNYARNETRTPCLSRSLDSTTTINDRLAIKLNPEIGPSYGVNDLSWGYANTTSYLATGCTNGSIVLWDINHPHNAHDPIQHQRLHTLDHVHNRAINKILFAGPTGHWVASGAQDSLVKIWDLRESSRPTMILTTHSDPVRQFRFFPDRTANPFDLFVLTDSGTLSQFDLRQQKNCLTRRVAHASTGVGLDWYNDGTSSLLASAGADGMVKIWNMGDSMLPTTPMRTLVVGRSLCGLAWRPGYATQLVITPSAPMADLGHQTYSDYERASSSSIISSYPDDSSLSHKPALHTTAARSASDTLSESNHPVPGGRHNEILIWDIRRMYVPETIIRGRDGPASGMVWLSPDLLLTIHKRSSAIVQHDVAQSSQTKYADELPSQALAVSKEGSVCFAIGSSDSSHETFYADNADEQPASAMVHHLSDLKPPDQFEFLALNYKFEDKSFESVCDHNAELCRRAGQPELWQLWNAVKLWFAPEVSAALIVAQDMSVEASNGNDQRAIAMAMRRVLNEDSSDEGELDFNKSIGGDLESNGCDRRSSSQDITASRKNSASGKTLVSDMSESNRDESVDSRSRARSPIPNLDRGGHGHRPKLSVSSLALPLTVDSGELLRKPSSRLGSATTPKAQVRSGFFGASPLNSNSANLEGSLESVRRRPTPLRSLAIDRDHSPISSPDTEGPPSRRSFGAHHQTKTDQTPDGGGHLHHNNHASWRRSMSKDRIAAKMHARGASFNELGSLIQAIGADKILSEKKTGDQWKNQEEKQAVEVQMRQSIVKILRSQVELNGNIQLGVYLIGILKIYHHQFLLQPHQDQSHEEEPTKSSSCRIIVGIDKDLLEDRFKGWIRSYINFLRRSPALLVVAAEIKLRFFNTSSFGFSIKEIEDQSVRILKLNPTCGNCGKVFTNSSVLPTHHQLSSISNTSNNQSLTMMMMMNNHKKKMLFNNPNNNSNLNLNTYYNYNTTGSSNNLKCDKCQFNVLRCCYCHESIKVEPLILCLKCGHGIHMRCLKKLNPKMAGRRGDLGEGVRREPVDKPSGRADLDDFSPTSAHYPSHALAHQLPSPALPAAAHHQPQSLVGQLHANQLHLITLHRPFLQCPSGCGCIGCFYSYYPS